MLTLSLNSFRSEVRRKNAAGKKFQKVVFQGKKGILLASRNGDRKIMQPIRIASGPTARMKELEPVKPVQENIYQSNTYNRDSIKFPVHFKRERRSQLLKQ